MPKHAAPDELLQHAAWLRRLVWQLVRDEATVDDTVQETWLAALRRPPDPGRPAKPWLANRRPMPREILAIRYRVLAAAESRIVPDGRDVKLSGGPRSAGYLHGTTAKVEGARSPDPNR